MRINFCNLYFDQTLLLEIALNLGTWDLPLWELNSASRKARLRHCGSERSRPASWPNEAHPLIAVKFSTGKAHGFWYWGSRNKLAAVHADDWNVKRMLIKTCKQTSTCRWCKVDQDDYRSLLWSGHLDDTFDSHHSRPCVTPLYACIVVTRPRGPFKNRCIKMMMMIIMMQLINSFLQYCTTDSCHIYEWNMMTSTTCLWSIESACLPVPQSNPPKSR